MLQRLALSDMDAAAHIHRIAFDRALPALAGLHTPEEDRSFFRERVFAECELWGAFGGAGMIGMIAFRKDWIDQLYVLPEGRRAAFTRRGGLRWCGRLTARAMKRRSLMRSICGRDEMRLPYSRDPIFHDIHGLGHEL